MYFDLHQNREGEVEIKIPIGEVSESVHRFAQERNTPPEPAHERRFDSFSNVHVASKHPGSYVSNLESFRFDSFSLSLSLLVESEESQKQM